MRLLGTILSALFALLAIVLFTAAACTIAFQSTLFNRATYDDVLEDNAIFEDVLTVALPAVLNAPEAEIDFEGRDESPVNIQEIVRALEAKPDVWERVTSLLIPTGWLQQNAILLVDGLFAVAEGNLAAIEQEVDLSEIRSRFLGDEAEQAARLIITEAPICTEQQLADLETFFNERSGTVPICNPEDTTLQNRSINIVELWFSFVAQELQSDVVTISQLFDIERDDARAFNLSVQLQQQGLILGYLCPMALLSLIIILTIRSLGGFGRWIGSVTIAVGVLILVLVFVLQVAAFGFISEAVASSSDAASIFLARLGSAIVRSAFGAISASLLAQSGIFIGIGFVIIALAWYLGRNRDDEEGSLVLVTEDGEIISTATKRRIGAINNDTES